MTEHQTSRKITLVDVADGAWFTRSEIKECIDVLASQRQTVAKLLELFQQLSDFSNLDMLIELTGHVYSLSRVHKALKTINNHSHVFEDISSVLETFVQEAKRFEAEAEYWIDPGPYNTAKRANARDLMTEHASAISKVTKELSGNGIDIDGEIPFV